jgi:F-type H+-transporting ATPase subunit b
MIAFLLMVWILKKFGWKPLLDLLRERREKIQAEFDSIDEQKKQVGALADEYQEKLKGIDAEARQKIQEAVLEGHKIAVGIQQKTQANANEIIQKAKEEVNREIANARTQLKNDMVGIAVAAAEKILQEKIDASKHTKLISEFVEEAELK